MPMPFKHHDGGREEAGYRGSVGDCVTRSICIATRLPYKQVYGAMRRLAKFEREGDRLKGWWRSHPRKGIDTNRAWFSRYMGGLGFEWVAMPVGTMLVSDTFGKGVYVVSLCKHYTAVVDGVIYDTYNPSRGRKRRVYGYWLKSEGLDGVDGSALSAPN